MKNIAHKVYLNNPNSKHAKKHADTNNTDQAMQVRQQLKKEHKRGQLNYIQLTHLN